jgi:hypothetical protein
MYVWHLISANEQVKAIFTEDIVLPDSSHFHIPLLRGSERHRVLLAGRIIHDLISRTADN